MIISQAPLAPIGQSGTSSDVVAVAGSNPAWGATHHYIEDRRIILTLVLGIIDKQLPVMPHSGGKKSAVIGVK